MISDRNIDFSRIKQHASQLREHFDTVHIFCTRESDANNTVHCQYGTGNWFARYGQLKSFINDTEKEYILGDMCKGEDKQEWEK